jgi:hypothetical protein
VVQNHIFNQYKEALVTYNLGVEAVFDSAGGTANVPAVDLLAEFAQWQWGPYQGGRNGSIQMPRYFFDLNRLVPEKEPPVPPGAKADTSMALALLALIAAAAAVFYLWKTGRLNLKLPRPVRK